MNRIFRAMMLFSAVWGLFSCTKFADPDPIFEDVIEAESAEDRRFLYINIDGAVGEIVQQVNPTTIASILPHSKYSFYSLSDEQSNDGTTWKSIMSGVNPGRHHIANEDFSEDEGDDHVHAANVSYPSIFYRIMTTKPYFRTFAFVSNPLLLQHVMAEAIDKEVFETDIEVRDHAVDYLKDTKSKFGVINFTSVKAAGLASGFSADNPDYVAAINEVDAYIGEVLQAIENRPTRSKEQWIIVIQSNNGGTITGEQGGTSLPERNTFSLYYYPTFSPVEYAPDLTGGTRIYALGTHNNNISRNGLTTGDNAYLNMTGDEMTIEFSYILNEVKSASSNIFILGKSTINNQNQNSTNANGWGFIYRQNAIGFFYRAGSTSTYLIGSDFPTGSTTSWTHYAATVRKDGDKYVYQVFQNGSLIRTSQADNPIDFSTAPFEIVARNGHNAGAPQQVDVSFRNIRVWDKSFTSEEVKELACMDEVSMDRPDINNLIANYPLTRDLANKVSGRPNLVANTNYENNITMPVYSWNTICSATIETIVRNQDLAMNVFYWLRMQNSNWPSDGNLILEQYDQEFYNQ